MKISIPCRLGFLCTTLTLDNETKYRISPFNIDRRLTNILTYILWSDILFYKLYLQFVRKMANTINIFRFPFSDIFTIINPAFIRSLSLLSYKFHQRTVCKFVFRPSRRDLEDFSWSDWKMELSTWLTSSMIFQSEKSF